MTTRRLMAIVAAVALLLGVWKLVERGNRYIQKANMAAREALTLELLIQSPKRFEELFYRGGGMKPDSMAKAKAEAANYRAEERRYRRAAWRPWESVQDLPSEE